MKITSSMFGSAEIADDKLIEFPLGLPGFEQCRRFALVHEEGSDSGVFLLHSVDDPELAFSVTGPQQLGISFEFPLGDADIELLQLEAPEDATVAVIVRRDAADEGGPASTGLRANFMAPLVINTRARRGLQKVLNRVGCEVLLRAQG